MAPLQRTAYRLGLASIILVGAGGALWLALTGPGPAGVPVLAPAPTATQAPIAVPPVADATSPRLLNLNTASRAELEDLPLVGEVLADRIVQYRNDNGPFLRVDHVMAVRGVGPTTYEAIRKLVVAEPPE